MKKILFLSLILLCVSHVFAQKRFERIKALKTAYITDKLELTPEEAEKFWPIYNPFEKGLFKYTVLKKQSLRKEINDRGGIDKLTEEEAQQILQKIAQHKADIAKFEKEKYSALQKVLSAKKLLKLYKAEEGFNRELLKRFRKQRGKKRS